MLLLDEITLKKETVWEEKKKNLRVPVTMDSSK